MAVDKMQTDEQPSTTGAATTEPAKPEAPKVQDVLKSALALVETAVKQKEGRLMSGRIMRLTASIRKQLTGDVLGALVSGALPADVEAKAFLLGYIEKAKAVEAASSAMQTDDSTGQGKPSFSESSTPEVEFFAYLLVIMYLADKKAFVEAREVAVKAVERAGTFNRRTLDAIAARIYFYYAWAHEKTGQLGAVRSTLLALHRTAVLRHDDIGQETLLVALLRSYLAEGLYEQAEKFRSKVPKASDGTPFRSHQQYCRYLYYLGRIRATQLEYSEARDCLQQASRKAPTSALGFRVAADKWLILVRLLLGEVPDRVEFAQPGLSRPLRPYFELTQAVRTGDLVAFGQVAERHAGVFRADATRNLVTRLHHNVLRTGLRRIALAYSRISLADVASKLHLPSVEDAECIVAKAIRDGGIDAVIDHEAGAMLSRDTSDVYTSGEPAEAFHARVTFCLDLHNEAVKAMRFEPDAHRRAGSESAEARAERLALEAEAARAAEEGDDDEF